MHGTDCYLAPEVLSSQKFNNRVDMFALGCILVECVTGRQLFRNSWEIQTYSQQTAPANAKRIEELWPPSDDGTRLRDLQHLAVDLLAVEPTSRPGASETLRWLSRLRSGLRPIRQLETDDGNSDEYFPVGAEDIVFEEALVQDSLRNGWSSAHSPQRNSTPELKFPTPLINVRLPVSHDAGDERFVTEGLGTWHGGARRRFGSKAKRIIQS
jgi:serine/threonine protein kinase